MKTIYKYHLDVTDVQKVLMPKGAEVVDVKPVSDRDGFTEDRYIALWAMVESEAEKETRTFFIAGTGHPLPAGLDLDRHVGTVRDRDALVWHVFDVTLA